MPRATAAVLITGSELLLGLVADRNTQLLARSLDAHGIELRRVLAVGDALDDIVEGLGALAGHDVVVTSGGLGPTHDDRTMEAVAQVVGAPLVLDAPTLALIDERTAAFVRERGHDPAAYRETNRKQALVPGGCSPLPPAGTAPGVIAPWGPSLVVVLPGPPGELRRVWDSALAHPRLRGALARAATLERRALRVFGVGESVVARAFAEAGGDAAGTVTTICARRLEVEVLVRAEPARRAALDALADGMRARLGAAVYAEDERPLEAHVVEALRAAGLTLAVAESCTAGLVAARVAEVPGASDVLAGGVVAYADAVKRALLGVPDELLATHGAVSAECAAAMAAGARRATGADVAVAVTGIAGPGGGSAAKPVGLVHLHVSSPSGELPHRAQLPGGREEVREWAATLALQLVRTAVAQRD